jgi:hypothetical protein
MRRKVGQGVYFFAATLSASAAGMALPDCGGMTAGDCADKASCPEPEVGSNADGSDTGGQGGPRGDADAGAAVSIDEGVDVLIDAGAAVSIDEGADVSIDASADVSIDAGADVSIDAGADVSIDAGADVSIDAGADGSIDAGADGSIDAGATTDTRDSGAPACNPANPFGTPVLVPGIESTSTEGGLRLTPDELTGFFWSSRAGGPGSFNLYATTRSSPTASFGNVLLLNNVNQAGAQYDPTVTGDGLTLAFSSNRASDAGSFDLYGASRTGITVDFTNIVPLAPLNTAFNDEQPFLVPGGSEIYFSCDRTGDFDIYRATGAGGQFASPNAVGELNLAAIADEHPAVSADDLTIVFSSNRAGGAGDLDVWMAERTTTTVAFGVPANVTTVNSTAKDIPDWLSADKCRLYLHSDRSGAEHEYLASSP